MRLELDYPPLDRGVVVVMGYLGHSPYGGMTWQVLHHMGGFRKLGFDVWYVEDSDAPMRDPETLGSTMEVSRNISYLRHQMEAIGLPDRWAIRFPGQDHVFGHLDRAGLESLYLSADAVFNLCGSHHLLPRHEAADRLVLLETDPPFNQIEVDKGNWYIAGELAKYDVLFTYATNLGQPDCPVPSGSLDWRTSRPPVVVDWWDGLQAPADGALTTIANWRDHGKDIEWRGETYTWRKDTEFMKYIALAASSSMPLELALEGIPDNAKQTLARAGWSISSAAELRDPAHYRDFIRTSSGEWTVAKDQVARLNTGWFSDRSVCYLAAGRPVITQDTGFGRHLPLGEGLMAFSDEASAREAIEFVASDYDRHAKAAQEVAREYFDATRVLGDVAEALGL